MARILCNVAGGGKPLKGNAETGDVLSGKTFSNKQSNALTGSMPNNGAWSASTSGNGSVTIPAGYHNGSGTVSGAASYNSGYTNGYRSKKLMLLRSGTIHGGDPNAASLTYKFNENYDQVIVVCNSCRDQKNDYGGMTMSYSGSGSTQVLSDNKISEFSSATRVIIRQITNVSANDSIILGMNDIHHWGCFAILG